MDKKSVEQRQWELCEAKYVETFVQKNENTPFKFDVILY